MRYSRQLQIGHGWSLAQIGRQLVTAARAARDASEAPELTEIIQDGTPVAVVVPHDLVEYALRHGWGR